MLGMVTLLFEYGISLNAEENDLYTFIINISTGETGFEQIVEWLKNNAEIINQSK
jgi:prophage maintenance system killer protein